MKITVLGSGGWGTALALLLLENGHEVTLWSYTEEESRVLRETRENPMLKGVPLPETMGLTTDMGAVKGCGAVVMATPSFAVRATAAKLKQLADPGTIVISVSKGIEKDTSLRLSQVIEEELQGHCPVVVLSGPSHAEEVGRHVPTGVVAASEDLELARQVQDLFMNPRFRVYTSTDKVGTELCAALKNIIALCAGCCDGMGCGDNTKALLMTRGLAEMARLGVALGGKQETFGRAGRRGGPDRHLLFHALPEPPVRHPHRQRGGAQRGGEGDRRRGGGLLRRCHRPHPGPEGGHRDAHRPGRLRGAL